MILEVIYYTAPTVIILVGGLLHLERRLTTIETLLNGHIGGHFHEDKGRRTYRYTPGPGPDRPTSN